MTTEKQLDSVRRKVMRYCYEDGFVEMALGTVFLVASLCMTLVLSVERSYVWLAGIVALLIMAAVGYAATRVVGNFKERITYLRTGYVEAGNLHQNSRRTEFGAALAIMAATLALVLIIPDVDTAVSIYNGLILAWSVGFIGYRVDLKRLYGVAMLALASGLLIAPLEVPEAVRHMGPFAVTGLALLVMGSMALRSYLEANPQED